MSITSRPIVTGGYNTQTGSTDKVLIDRSQFSVHVSGKTTSGSGASESIVQVSNIPTPSGDGDWVDAATISLTLSADSTGDAVAILVPYKWVRIKTTTLSGTGAELVAYMCGG